MEHWNTTGKFEGQLYRMFTPIGSGISVQCLVVDPSHLTSLHNYGNEPPECRQGGDILYGDSSVCSSFSFFFGALSAMGTTEKGRKWRLEAMRCCDCLFQSMGTGRFRCIESRSERK